MSELSDKVAEAHRAIAQAAFALVVMLVKRRINREALDEAITRVEQARRRLEDLREGLPVARPPDPDG